MAQFIKAHKGEIIVCAIAVLAFALSITSYIHTKNHIALDNAFVRYRYLNQFYHALDNDGKLTNQDKQTVLPLLLWAGSALMERNWDETDFYLTNAATYLEEVYDRTTPKVDIPWTKGTGANQTIVRYAKDSSPTTP